MERPVLHSSHRIPRAQGLRKAAPAPGRIQVLWSALAWLWLMSPVLWMWPGLHALADVLASSALLLCLWLWRPLLRVAALALLVTGAIYLGYFYAVRTVPDEYFWFSVLSANGSEALEYAAAYRFVDVLRLGWWLLPAIAAVLWLWRHAASLRGRWRWLGYGLLLLWLAYAAISMAKGNTLDSALRKIARVYPSGLVESYLRYTQASAGMFVLPAAQPAARPVLADIVVVVIGESASAQRWSLLGYSGNPTNAALNRWRAGMVVLPVHTNGNNTAQTVPLLLTGQALDVLPAQGVATYLDWARDAGFGVSTISNQGSMGVGQSFFFTAFHQRSHRFVTMQNGLLDGAMTPLLREQIDQAGASEQPLLLTVHMYGSHPRVESRYPPGDAQWADPYDNSIAYSSTLLAQWIGQLDALNNQRVLLLYVSDHGLSFPACGGTYVHGFTRSAYEVPLMLWGNARFRQANAAWWQQWQLRSQHAVLADGGLRYSNLLVPDALADVLGVGTASRLPAVAPSAASEPAGAYPPADQAQQCLPWHPYKAPVPAADAQGLGAKK